VIELFKQRQNIANKSCISYNKTNILKVLWSHCFW